MIWNYNYQPATKSKAPEKVRYAGLLYSDDLPKTVTPLGLGIGTGDTKTSESVMLGPMFSTSDTVNTTAKSPSQWAWDEYQKTNPTPQKSTPILPRTDDNEPTTTTTAKTPSQWIQDFYANNDSNDIGLGLASFNYAQPLALY